MEFNQQESEQNSIVSVDHSQIKLTHTTLNTPCFISPRYSSEIKITNLEDLDKASLFPLSSQDDIDLLIIGTGSVTQFLHPKQQVDIQQMGIGVESMNNESACRSFNLLLSDIRRVGLLLL
ncbi:MAG: Mth938-like domain-containing protein [Gammaproteobacteria bacterium]|nr:Mth938-like domain-containing protein [Gammaproteobacteria bacterium]